MVESSEYRLTIAKVQYHTADDAVYQHVDFYPQYQTYT